MALNWFDLLMLGVVSIPVVVLVAFIIVKVTEMFK